MLNDLDETKLICSKLTMGVYPNLMHCLLVVEFHSFAHMNCFVKICYVTQCRFMFNPYIRGTVTLVVIAFVCF